MARKRKSRRRKNISREDWIDHLIEEAAEYEGVEAREVELTDEIQAEIDAYVDAVDEVVEKCSTFFPPAQPIVVDEDTYLDIYHTLSGAGAGIWDGRWDHYYPGYSRDQWQALIQCYRAKLRRFVDETGGGSLPMAISDAVYDAKPDVEDSEDDEEIDDDVVGGALDAQLDAINRYRRQLHMPELDARRSGWTPDDIRSEYLRIQQSNPARTELLAWELR